MAMASSSIMQNITRTISALFPVILCLIGEGCGTSSPIQRYSESKSHFSHPPELMSNNYPQTNIYRIYYRASTGFTAIQTLRNTATQRAETFAQQQGKSIAVLGEQISQPPYILGNFPRLELVFALIDKPGNPNPPSPALDKYAQLERLKKLLDQGAITQEEFEKEKAKLLN
jgi:hypothetical protein